MPQPVEIYPYDANWIKEFEGIGAAMRRVLGEVALRIDHMGSTSIPNLSAKPIIDIQISVAELNPQQTFQKPLESLGYEWRNSDKYELTKRYFRETNGMRRTHIHVRKLGSWHQPFPLLFRDYLREHKEDCSDYEDTKKRLAKRFRHERERYSESKSEIFWKIIAKADAWAANTGWEPGASNA